MLSDDITDEELMLLYQNGAEEAFEKLYQRHSSKVYGYIRSKVKKKERAREVFQEVFMKIHRSKHLYNKSLPALPWIFTVARTIIIDEIRKEKPLHLVDVENLANDIVTSADNTSLAIERLPEAQKNAVQMRFIEEKTFEEIASQLQLSEGNVRQLVSRGIRKLRSILKSGANNG